jgi:hypothetical protein
MKRSTAKKMGLTPLYMIEDMVSIAAAPNLLPVAPALAIKKLMNRTGLTLDQVDIIEINEAFACVPLVSLKLLSCRAFIEDDYAHAAAHIANYPIDTFNEVTFKKLLGKLNVNGGAIAIGHANIKQAVIRWKHGFGLGPLAKLPVIPVYPERSSFHPIPHRWQCRPRGHQRLCGGGFRPIFLVFILFGIAFHGGGQLKAASVPRYSILFTMGCNWGPLIKTRTAIPMRSTHQNGGRIIHCCWPSGRP